jgi:sulfatase modifying factor 1
VGERVSLPCVALAVVFAVVFHAQVARSENDEVDAFVRAAAAPPPPPPANESSCGAGMVEVLGDYCPELPEQKCRKWVNDNAKGRCAEFEPSEACATATVRKHFCMDRFEYPNLPGEKPLVMKSWLEARVVCTSAGKRLCNDSEWTLACEGPERLPYPYGLSRDATACNIDKPPISVHEEDLRNLARRDAETKRLWQGEPSGARDRCKSAFGVQDMTGNVDEWVVNEKGKPHKSALKGGYWSWVRARCRPLTDGHAEDFRYYQIGFRCCSDAPIAAEPATASASR